jgi:hypothetical protein
MSNINILRQYWPPYPQINPQPVPQLHQARGSGLAVIHCSSACSTMVSGGEIMRTEAAPGGRVGGAQRGAVVESAARRRKVYREIGWHRQRQRGCHRLAEPVGARDERDPWRLGRERARARHQCAQIELIALAKRCLPLGVVLTGYLIPSALIEPTRQPRGSRNGMLFPQASSTGRHVQCRSARDAENAMKIQNNSPQGCLSGAMRDFG